MTELTEYELPRLPFSNIDKMQLYHICRRCRSMGVGDGFFCPSGYWPLCMHCLDSCELENKTLGYGGCRCRES